VPQVLRDKAQRAAQRQLHALEQAGIFGSFEVIAAAQCAEHYEIAEYGTLRAWARVLGKSEAVQLLDWTLEEEKRADQKLTSVASSLNFQAAAPQLH
jgi:ferritin-like metal-binding protein YciE